MNSIKFAEYIKGLPMLWKYVAMAEYIGYVRGCDSILQLEEDAALLKQMRQLNQELMELNHEQARISKELLSSNGELMNKLKGALAELNPAVGSPR